MARIVNEQLRQQKRAVICTAAEKLFAANGFAYTTISSIAKEAGVSHAAVFTYFPSKEDLIYYVVLEPLQESRQRLEWIIAENKPVVETLRAVVQEHIKMVVERRTFLCLTQQVMGHPEQYPELTRSILNYGENFINMLEPLIKKGQAIGELEPGDARMIGWTYFAFFNGAGLIFIDSSDDFVRLTSEYALRTFGIRTS
jgi:AcrR family transcriptional regulator